MSSALALVVVLVVVALVVAVAGVKMVPRGSNWTIERFGRYTRTLPPGLHLIVPFVDTVGHKINMQEDVLDIPAQKVVTKDSASVQVQAVASYRVVDAARAAYEVHDLQVSVTDLALTSIRNVIGDMTVEHVLTRRHQINEALLSLIDRAANPWGVKVLRIELKDIVPPADMLPGMAAR